MRNNVMDISRMNPKQELFFTAKQRYVAYGGARGGGKSWSVRNKSSLLALNYPGIKILILRRTFPELQENHIRWLQKDLNGIAAYNDSKKIFTFQNGSIINLGYCRTESDVTQYQGQEYDVMFIDEATQFTWFQFEQLKACVRGANNFPKRVYLTCNPGGVGHMWIKRLFLDRNYEEGENPEDYSFIPARVTDNTVLMQEDPEYVKVLESLNPTLRKAWLEGDWNIFAGQYFPEFRHDIHVVKPKELPSYYKRFRSVDYGMDMTACYWWAADTDGICHIYRELHEPNLNISEAAKKILSMTPANEKIAYTVASPDLWNRRQDRGISGVEIMTKSGLAGLVKADNRRIEGWRALREYLAPYDDGRGTTARLLIFNTCPKLIESLPALIHDKHKPEDAADEPHEFTHAPESIRYGIMSRPPVTKYNPRPKGKFTPGELEDLGYKKQKITRRR